MRVMPLAADSLGARSMATYVEAGALRLLIDPGVTWRRAGTASPRPGGGGGAGPRALGIEAYAVRATHVAVSHFRADHFGTDTSLYAGRRVWAKDPPRDRHQASQGRVLAGDPPAPAIWTRRGPAGGGRRGDDPLLAPAPARRGRLRVRARRGGDRRRRRNAVRPARRTSRGRPRRSRRRISSRERPDLVYLSGPPTYLQSQVGHDVVQRGIDNLVRLVGETGCRVIVDHHAVREPRFRERLAQAFDTGRIVTAAEYLGRRDECLEAWRAALWARRRERSDIRDATGGP